MTQTMSFKTQYKSREASSARSDWLSVGETITRNIVRDGQVVGTVTTNPHTWLVRVASGGDIHTRSYRSERGAEQSGRILAERLAEYLGGEIA